MKLFPTSLALAAFVTASCTSDSVGHAPTGSEPEVTTTQLPEVTEAPGNTENSVGEDSEPVTVDTTNLVGFELFTALLNPEDASQVSVGDYETVAAAVCSAAQRAQSPGLVTTMVSNDLLETGSPAVQHLLDDHRFETVLAAGQSHCPAILADAGVTNVESLASFPAAEPVTESDFEAFIGEVDALGGSLQDSGITPESLASSAEVVCVSIRTAESMEEFTELFAVSSSAEAIWVLAAAGVFCDSEAAVIGFTDASQLPIVDFVEEG